jgi:arylsulfatase
MAVYAAMVERMDRGIGRVLDVLPPNTFVLFLSDNGASAEEYDRVTPDVMPGPRESFHTCGPPWANVSNTPLRSYKHWVHEGGISTPFIVSGPGVMKGVTKEPAHLIDVLPTFTELSGAVHPSVTEGKSLVPVLRGGRLEERPLFWEHEGNKAVRRGRWKLVARHKQPWELYDLDQDRGEGRDLSAGEPDRVKALAVEWEAWAARVGSAAL